MTGYEKARRVLCLFILFAASAAALATVAAPFEYGIKAPLLALASGLFILAGIIPVRLSEPEQIPGLVATSLGALAAIGAAGYWLYDATGGMVFTSLYLVAVTATLFLFYLVMLAWWAWLLITRIRSRSEKR